LGLISKPGPFCFIFLGIFLSFTRPSSAGSSTTVNSLQISGDLDETIQRGFNQLFNLKFDKAIQTFESIQDQAEEHPIAAFALASAHWWRLSIYVLETDKQESRAFLDAVKKGVLLCKTKIKQGDPTGEAHLALGGMLGIYGRWKLTNRHWLSAYFKGKKAYKHLTKALEINPDLNDAYMGIGMFDYYVAKLSGFVRVIAFRGMGKDPQKGLDELHKAAEKSGYAQTPSNLFLVEIYSTQENRPDLALKIVEILREDSPRSPYLHILHVGALYNFGSLEELQTVSKDCLEHVKQNFYGKEFETSGNFALGITYFKNRNWTEAIQAFDKAIETKNTLDSYYTWSFLFKGYALDVLGERKEAVAQYHEVLNQRRRWNSYDNAKARLKKPFSGDDEELRKLNL